MKDKYVRVITTVVVIEEIRVDAYDGLWASSHDILGYEEERAGSYTLVNDELDCALEEGVGATKFLHITRKASFVDVG